MGKSVLFKRISVARWILLLPFAAGTIAVYWALPTIVSSQKGAQSKTFPKFHRNFDIRDSKDVSDKLSPGRSSQDLAAIERKMEAGAARLKKAVPGLELKTSAMTKAPEIVGVVNSGQKLTGRSSSPRASIVRNFIAANSDLYGLSPAQVNGLKVTADYRNPAGNLSWVEFEQRIGRIPVFQGALRAALTKDGELVRTTGNLVPGLDYDSISGRDSRLLSALAGLQNAAGTDEGLSEEAAAAIASGAGTIGMTVDPAELVLKQVSEDGLSYVFEAGPFAADVTAELVYFPVVEGEAVLAWSMTLWQDVPAFYTLVSADDRSLLWRKNITEEQTQSATYSVYNDDSPAPLSPSNASPGVNVQAAAIPRTVFSLVSEHPSNNLGWLADGVTTTTGNNVDAGLDIVSPNGIDPGGRPVSAARNFVYDYDPAPGIVGGVGSNNPADTDYRWGAVTNLFFWSNRYHDILYGYGFTEAARNFQNDNFGRNPGGLTANARNGVDRVLAEAQDFSGTNNANFSTPADGSSGRMQMYRWNNPVPNRDGDLDNEIVIHELTHGTSNRLHNNASGLGATTSRGMGEGWSDFYARAILSTADEDVNGLFTVGGYATYLAAAGYTNNYYYGIRRFPYAVMSTVGPNGKPHNPLTFADTNPNTIDLTDGAFPRGIFGVGGRAGATAVHNVGEIWSMALLEVRARIINRMGYAAGNQRMLQLVTDAMKLDPVNPTLIDGRNSLLAADVAFGSEDALDIWAGFATRGMGFGATMSITNVNGKESFDYPIPGMGGVSFTDWDGNGAADVGEKITLSVPLTNPLSQTISGVTAQAVGGGAADFGTIDPGQTVVRNITFQVPVDAVCGDKLSVSIVVDSSLGQETKTFVLQVGSPVLVPYENFDGVAAPALPAGWTTARTGVGALWVTSTGSPDTAPNAAFVSFAANTGRSDLFTPVIAVPATGTTQLVFRHSYNSEFEWDGGALFINIEGVSPSPTSYLDILDAGGSFEAGGYPFVLVSSNSGNTNILQNRPAWTGDSGGYITTVVNLPASAAGRNIKLWFLAGSDSAFTVANSHWRVDSISTITSYSCATVATTTSAANVSGQYSDSVNLSATVSSDCPDVTGTLNFKVGGVSVGSVPVNGTGNYSLAYTAALAPGNYTVTADFTSSNPYFTDSSGNGTLTVTKEDAVVAFPASNPVSVKVNSAGGTAGPITFCADISDYADGFPGDISNATASFSFSPVAGGASPSPGAVTYSGGGVGGTRRACVTLNNVSVDVYDVTVTVGGYYQGTGSSVLAVYDPSLGFVTGGGTVINNGYVGNFGINVKYLKNGKPQGSMLYIEHRPGGVVKIKSNSMQSLSIVNNTAVIISKAVLDGVGNHDFRVTVVDNGEPGSSDRFGILTNSPGGTNIPSLTFAPVTLRGGNIQVPKK